MEGVHSGGGTLWRGYTVEGIHCGGGALWSGYTVEGVHCGVGTLWRGYTVEGVHCGGGTLWRGLLCCVTRWRGLHRWSAGYTVVAYTSGYTEMGCTLPDDCGGGGVHYWMTVEGRTLLSYCGGTYTPELLWRGVHCWVTVEGRTLLGYCGGAYTAGLLSEGHTFLVIQWMGTYTAGYIVQAFNGLKYHGH